MQSCDEAFDTSVCELLLLGGMKNVFPSVKYKSKPILKCKNYLHFPYLCASSSGLRLSIMKTKWIQVP